MPETAHDRGTHDSQEDEEVDSPLDTERLFLPTLSQGLSTLFFEVEGVQEEVDHQKNRRGEGQDRGHTHGPEEGDSVEETEKEGGIPEGGQTPTDVGNQEDEEGDGVNLILPFLVGPKDGSDHQHGRPGRPDPGGEEGSHKEDESVHGGSPLEGTLQKNPSRDREEGPKEEEEGDVVDKDDGDQLVLGLSGEGDEEGDKEEERPEEGDLPEVVVPKLGGQEGKEGDGEENAHEGDS